MKLVRTTLALAATLAFATSATAQNFYTILDGAQEPAATPATGSGTFVIDTAANTLMYNISFSGLLGSQTNAHIHGPANPGSGAGFQHIIPLGSPVMGTWLYPESMEADILGGRMYINIHSSMFTAGEIRGQVVPTPIAYCECTNPHACAILDVDGGCQNTTGDGANITFDGLPSLSLDTLTLTSSPTPPNEFGIFYMGDLQINAPFGDGRRCAGGNVLRFPLRNSGPGGTTTEPAGIGAFHGVILPGDTVYFQHWFRDPGGSCGSSFNLSDALEVTWTI